MRHGATYLQQHLDTLSGTRDERGRHGRDRPGGSQLRYRQGARSPVGSERVYKPLAEIVALRVSSNSSVDERVTKRTQNEMAKMGVTPNNGGVIPLYILPMSSVTLCPTCAGAGARSYSPPDTILRDRLPHDINRACVGPRRSRLQPRLGQVERMTDEDTRDSAEPSGEEGLDGVLGLLGRGGLDLGAVVRHDGRCRGGVTGLWGNEGVCGVCGRLGMGVRMSKTRMMVGR